LRSGICCRSNEWYGQTLYSQLNDTRTGAIILIMHRLHEDDLTGHVLAQEDWEIVLLPAIAEDDETWGSTPSVDDDDVGAASGQQAADRGGEQAALGRGVELGRRLPLRREAGRKLRAGLADKLSRDCRRILASDWYRQVFRKYEGTRLGRHELNAGTARRHAGDAVVAHHHRCRSNGGRAVAATRRCRNRSRRDIR
jgi:hypothetical protein